ncbi:MAG: hypothetical protein AB9903_23975 [Vulcanimicrobiota bacterium]
MIEGDGEVEDGEEEEGTGDVDEVWAVGVIIGNVGLLDACSEGVETGNGEFWTFTGTDSGVCDCAGDGSGPCCAISSTG